MNKRRKGYSYENYVKTELNGTYLVRPVCVVPCVSVYCVKRGALDHVVSMPVRIADWCHWSAVQQSICCACDASV